MNVAAWARNHARSILFLLALLALAGAGSSFILPVALFPHVDFPRVELNLDAGDRPAEQMAVEVTYPVEEALRAVPGVRSVRSTTSRGSAEIWVAFDWGQDMVSSLLQAQAAVNGLLPSLPAETTFDIKRMDTTVFPVIAYSLTSDTRTLAQLHDLAYYDLRPSMTTITGVAKVDVQGGDIDEYRVVVDPDKLRQMNLSIADVADSLSASNVLTAVGKMEDHDKLYLVVSDTRLRDKGEIGQTIVRSGANGVVRLAEIASIETAPAPNYTRVTADGHDAVLLQVYQQPGGNTVEIAANIRDKLEEEKGMLPLLKDGSVKVASWYDQSDLIVASAGSVRDSVLVGIGLAALVLLLFLRNWKITLIATMAVPTVLASTVLILYVTGMSFNIMTLGGMAAAVGLIIDDAIVMVEHIVRRLRSGEGEAHHRVLVAAGEFTRPLIGSSASTIIIFAPLAFLTGVTGAFFKALSLTMAAGLVISFLVSWVAVPVLAAHVLGPEDIHQKEGGRLTERFQNTYGWIMTRLLPHPWIVLIILAPLLGAGYFAYNGLASGFMPTMDEGGFILDYIADPGTSLPETDRLLRQVEAILQATPEVQTYSRRTGLQLGGDLTEANTGDFFIRLKPLPRRPIEEVMEEVRKKVQGTVPGLDIETAQLMEDLIGDLTSVPEPIEIKIFSDDENTLSLLAPKVADAIGDPKVRGVVEVENGLTPAGDALDIQVDRVKAALEGVGPDDVTKFINDELSGNVTTQIQEGPKMVGVRVWLPDRTRATDRDLRELPVRAPDGHVFPLSRVATISTITGQPEIDREDLKRMVAVTGRIEGRDLGSTLEDVKKVLDAPGMLPPGVTYELGGVYKEQQTAFRGLTIVLVASIMLVFALLLFLYERLRVAIAMLLMPLLALPAVFIGLWLTNTEWNITSKMGATMIVGIVTEVAIFYYSEFADLPGDMPIIERMIAAGKHRMRAIAMTTIAAILALSPLALGIGQGSAMQQPLAIAIITGLVVQLPLALVVMPAVMMLIRAHGEPKEL